MRWAVRGVSFPARFSYRQIEGNVKGHDEAAQIEGGRSEGRAMHI